MIRIAGIDVGASGAIALIDAEKRTLRVNSIPVFKIKRVSGRSKTEIDEQNFLHILREMRPDYAIIEDLGARPDQGVVAMFTFGEMYGGVKMGLAACAIPYLPEKPAVWKRGLGVTSDKEQARQRASQLFPRCAGLWSRKGDHDRAEAAMLALHGCLINSVQLGMLEPTL